MKSQNPSAQKFFNKLVIIYRKQKEKDPEAWWRKEHYHERRITPEDMAAHVTVNYADTLPMPLSQNAKRICRDLRIDIKNNPRALFEFLNEYQRKGEES